MSIYIIWPACPPCIDCRREPAPPETGRCASCQGKHFAAEFLRELREALGLPTDSGEQRR